MKITIFRNVPVTIYIGRDTEKGKPPEITIQVEKPQISYDTDKYEMDIKETR